MPQATVAATAAELTDEAIVDRVRGGDVPLYEILVRRHNHRLYRTIRAILRDDRDVEDVMQLAYVDAYTHLDQFRGTAKFATWLTRIAVNRAIRSGHGERRQLALVSRDAGADRASDLAAAPGLDPEHAMYGHELKAVLESLVEGVATSQSGTQAYRSPRASIATSTAPSSASTASRTTSPSCGPRRTRSSRRGRRCSDRRKWKRSASSPAASRTTSTTS